MRRVRISPPGHGASPPRWLDLEARGFCGNPRVNLPLNELGKIDVGGGVGPGQLFVVRTKNLPGETQATPYSSITEIHSGEVADDINHFLVEVPLRPRRTLPP